MDFRLDKRPISVTTFAEQRRTNPDLPYWRGRPPAERVAAVEYLRRRYPGTGARLRRVLRVIDAFSRLRSFRFQPEDLVASGFSRKSASSGFMSASRRLGLRPEKRRSGGCLTMAGSPGGFRATATNHLSARVVPASVSKQRRPRLLRLCVVFRTDATGWPHRAATLTGTRRRVTSG